MSSPGSHSIFNGKKINPIKKGCLPGESKTGEIIACLNTLLFWRVTLVDGGQSGKVVLDDKGAVLELPRGGSAAVGGGLYAAGVYSTAVDYIPGAIVYTSPDSSTRYLWICELANGPSSALQAPTWTEPGTVYWRCYARGVGGGGTRYRVKAVYSTYLVCRTWDGTTEGTSDVYIAKPPHLRWYASAWPGYTAVGAAITFAWSALTGNIDGQRTAAASGATTQTEIVVPVWQYAANGSGISGGYDEIWADTPAGGTGVTTVTESAYSGAASPAASGTVLTLMDDNRNGRYWEQIS